MALGSSGVLPGGNAPGISATVVTKSDTVNILPGPSRMLWVGGAGNVAVMMERDTTAVTFVGVAAGTMLPLRVLRVMNTNTTATNIVAVF